MRKDAAGSTRGQGAPSIGDPALATQLQELLQRRLRETIGPERYGGMSRLADWRHGLVEGVEHAGLAGRLRILCARLARPDCAMALALNSFLPWQARPDGLRLVDTGGFRELQFDGRCPTGVRGTPPRVEVIASGPEGVVGAAARVFDYVDARPSPLSAGYRELAVEEDMAGWARTLRDGAAFRHLDAVALAKIAIGLGRIFSRRPVRLLYLFLEPENPRASVFAAHRSEVERLASLTITDKVAFHARSFHELWHDWHCTETPAPVRRAAELLTARYSVAMPH